MLTTVGQLLVNEELPPGLRDHSRVLDQAGVAKLFGEIEKADKGKFADINRRLHDIGQLVSTRQGRETSLSLDALRPSKGVADERAKLDREVKLILAGPGDTAEKHRKIVEAIAGKADRITELNYQEGLKDRNPFALQILSGSRGNKVQFRTLRAGDLLVTDHRDEPVPVPMLSSYAEGLDPVQYWAGAYGARRSEILKKFSTPKAGYLGKQLAMAAHRLVVTEKDCGTSTGVPATADDPDNEGAVLATDAAGIRAGTVLTPDIMRKLGDKKILVRSALTCQAERGLCGKCAGVRETGALPSIGSHIGIAAAHALSEPLSQGSLGAKHLGGTVSSGQRSKDDALDVVNRLVQVPEAFPGAAAVATNDGRVERVEDAPQGGTTVVIGGKEHWAAPGQKIMVKKNDEVEAGDVISDGMPNPADIVKHKGIGEGRRYFTDLFRKTLAQHGFKQNRRNVELVARGLINHVRITGLHGPNHTVMDDLVEFDPLMRGYEPREGSVSVTPKEARGFFLERPVLHYSVGTRITPRMAAELHGNGVKSVTAHREPPPFEPEMVRAVETMAHADDWMLRLGGLYGIQRSFLKSVHRGGTSDPTGTSYIPALAEGTGLRGLEDEED